jgi:Alginate export
MSSPSAKVLAFDSSNPGGKLSASASIGVRLVAALFVAQLGAGVATARQVQYSDAPAQPGMVFVLGDSSQSAVQPDPLGAPNSAEGDTQSKKGDAGKSAEERKKKQEELNKKIAGAHKPLYFDNDFSYVCDPDYTGWQLGDNLKRRCLPFGGWYDIGGEYRLRYHGERNHRGAGLTGVDDDFLLHRTRLYGDFHFSQNIRLFAEFIDAESNYENFAPRGIEVNRADMLNLFIDARLLADGDESLTARVGRQELLFGAQRVISPLDWANTRRTFEGVRLTKKSKDLAIDGFWTNPVRIDDYSFDSPDREQEFMGIYASYTGCKNVTTDLYALRYINNRGANDFEANTLGLRNQGENGTFLWDFESGIQFGQNNDGSDRAAGTATFGVGQKLVCQRWDPVLWFYYDWASGDGDLGQGNGYDHLFPLAHKYNGFMDLFGRRNLEDLNVMLTLSPTRKLKLLAWYHYLFLETKSDTPYSVVMAPFNPGNAPGSAELGHEIDLLATLSMTARQELQLGYSHFIAGDYYSTTPGVPYNGDASFFYTQWSLRY